MKLFVSIILALAVFAALFYSMEFLKDRVSIPDKQISQQKNCGLAINISALKNKVVSFILVKKEQIMAALGRKEEKKEEPKEKEEVAAPEEEPIESANSVTLYLKNGSSIGGELVRETPAVVTISWKGGDVGFSRAEIDSIEYGQAVKEKKGLLFSDGRFEWPYKNDVVVQLNNTIVLDAQIAGVGPDKIVLRYPVEGGGSIEQEIERAKIEKLLFKPVDNKESKKIEDVLKKLFPKMRIYDDGLFTIFTDSTGTWAERFKNVLNEHATDYYFTYFDILKDRRPKVRSFVVIFDSIVDFYIFGISERVLGASGYFDPVNEVLYMPNYLGSELDDWIDKVALAEVRGAVGYVEDFIKDRTSDRYDIFIEGRGDEIKGKFVKYYNFIKDWHRRWTYQVLRHETTHELFHNWGVQMVVLSKKEEASMSEEEVQKKKELMELKDGDFEKNKDRIMKLLHEIWSQREEALESFKEEAAHSWFVEGTATYSATSPIGGTNDIWLYYFQKARREKALLPLEQLTVYKMGSFAGVSYEPVLYAYGQSWAFTHFLMNNYKEEFMRYLGRMAAEKPEDDEDVTWLRDELGKDLRQIEKEFLAYMDQFEEAEDPDFNITQYDYYIKTFL